MNFLYINQPVHKHKIKKKDLHLYSTSNNPVLLNKTKSVIFACKWPDYASQLNMVIDTK